jgi:hypothetical protein
MKTVIQKIDHLNRIEVINSITRYFLRKEINQMSIYFILIHKVEARDKVL